MFTKSYFILCSLNFEKEKENLVYAPKYMSKVKLLEETMKMKSY